MANSRSITNDKIYDLVNSVRLELKADIVGLRSDFNNLEAGRLSQLEKKVNKFELDQARRDSKVKEEQATLSTKFLIVWSIVGAISIAIVTALAYRFIVGAPAK